MSFYIRKSQNPSLSSVHVDRPLTQISLGYRQDASGFIASQVFPMIPVSKKSDKYYKFDRASWNRDEFEKRAGGVESAEAGMSLSTDNYSADVWALHTKLDEQQEANADEVLELRSAATEFLTQKALISMERQWASTYFTTGIWGTDSSPSTKWDDTGGDMIADCRVGITAVHTASGGFRPNTLVLARSVWDKVQDSDAILGRLNRGQTSGPASANLDDLARLLELDRVLISDAVYNTAVEGASESNAFAIGATNEGALLCYVAPNPGRMVPSAGYMFSWTGLIGSEQGMRIKTIPRPELEADQIEAQMAYDHKLVGSEFGYFFNNTLV